MIGNALTKLVCALVISVPGSTIARRHPPGERRAEGLVALHGLKTLDVGLGHARVGLELQHGHLGGVALGQQLLRARQVAPLVLEVGDGGVVLLIDLRRLDHGDDLPGLDPVAAVHQNRLHVAADLGVHDRLACWRARPRAS